MNSIAPYTLNDILLLLGQSTVELAWLRARIADLEAQLANRESPNGAGYSEEVVRADHS